MRKELLLCFWTREGTVLLILDSRKKIEDDVGEPAEKKETAAGDGSNNSNVFSYNTARTEQQ